MMSRGRLEEDGHPLVRWMWQRLSILQTILEVIRRTISLPLQAVLMVTGHDIFDSGSITVKILFPYPVVQKPYRVFAM